MTSRTKLIDLYKSLNDKPLYEQEDPYKDLASVGKYDQGNEPLEIQYHEDQQLYYIEPEDIEAYVSGETVFATDPDRGMDDVEVNRENSDVTGVSEDELEDFIASSRGDQFADDLNENEKDLEKAIIDVLKKEGGAAGLEPILAIANKLGVTKSQIKKVLNSIGKVKKHTNGDYILTPINEKSKSGKRPDYADVDGDGDEEESMEKAFKDKEKLDEYGCTEEEIAEGTCGYGEDGKIGRKPAGPNFMGYKKIQERFKKLANIKK